MQRCIQKLIDLYASWRTLQKNSKKKRDIFRRREKEFEESLDNLFDIAQAEAFQLIKIEDKVLLLRRREPGRVGYLGGIDKKLSKKEENRGEETRKELFLASTSSAVSYVPSSDESIKEVFTSDESNDSDISCHFPENTQNQDILKSGKKNFITPKLVASLDRRQLNVRDSVYIIHAVAEALGHNAEEFIINKSSIHRIRQIKRKESAESIKVAFQNDILQILTVHWDGKLLPALNVKDAKEGYCYIIVSFGDREQLIGVPKLQNATGKEKEHAVWIELTHWCLETNVQILCSDTNASNTGRLNGACILLEQKLNREMLFFPCRHHINIKSGKEYVERHFNETEIREMLVILEKKLKKQKLRGDLKELNELCIIFLGGNTEKKFKIHPPGAMHQARWMARAIYSLKMFLFKSQLTLSVEHEKALETFHYSLQLCVCDTMQCSCNSIQTRLCFLKSYERIDETVSGAALKKFIQHLWYLSEELSVLSLFDEDVDVQLKLKIVANLDHKTLDDFVFTKSKDFFYRLHMETCFLQECPSQPGKIMSHLEVKRIIIELKAVNDSLERGVKLTLDFNGLLTVD
ncbi:hypothetical protein AVEN_72597-1 [Araneus ventricosus]|uniref:Uncharacterized protein n=1 Tax=Araneus ventricosus TaxID=182803 RepID=A0A4Y2KNB2_ARAVE|nr:hypothetical protein AVEN_72597-1 [Araneus ventricosus]